MPDGHEAGTAPGTTSEVVLSVEGMHCGSCAALIEETLIEDLGVVRARVDLGTNEATVAFDPSLHTVNDLCDAIVAAGYTATPVG